jgi:hypothetical protein
LGVGLSPTRNFKNAKQGSAEKATRALYECLRLGRLYILSIKCQLDFFDEMVKPVLLYGCEIWGMGNNDILERVQDQLLTLPLIQCRQHTRYKTIVNIFLACFQVRLRLFLNHDLNYKSVKKIQGHLNIMQKEIIINSPLV